MRNRLYLAVRGVAVAALLAGAGHGQYLSLAGTGLAGRIKDSSSAALTGQVNSQEEGPMEGVLVSAKGAGTTVTVTVVTDSQGLYGFPKTKLSPGRYALAIRAVGYDLASPAVVDIAPNRPAQADLKLVKTADLTAQLTSAEWLLSVPGTEEQKAVFRGCTGCHSAERIVKSTHDATEWVAVMERMSTYALPSSPFRIVRLPGGPDEVVNPERRRRSAEYLAMLNLSSGPWKYPLQTLSRPKGKATRVIITEYDLPRKNAEPHDVVMGPDGMIWYSDFAEAYLGRMNPRTLEIKEFAVPELKAGFPPGSLDVEFDKEGNVWLGRLMQGGVARFNPKTEEFTSWKAPEDYNNKAARTAMVAPQNQDYDGKVWFDNAPSNVLHRLDLKTGAVETMEPYREIGKDSPDGAQAHSHYSIATDARNNIYFTDLAGGNIGTVDAKTGKLTLYPTPTKNSAPRRMRMDSEGRLWFGENSANRIGMFDPSTAQFREWLAPIPWSNPYDAVLDKNEEAWTGSTFNDRVLRLNVETGQWTEYLLPRHTNIRRVFVDNSTTPVTFWVGNNHGASIVKLEPLE